MTDSRELPGHSLGRSPRATSRLVHTGDPRSVVLEVSYLAAETGGDLPARDAWWVEATFDDETRSRFPTYPSAAEERGAASRVGPRPARLSMLSLGTRTDGRQIVFTWELEVLGSASMRSVRSGWEGLGLSSGWLQPGSAEAGPPSFRIQRPDGWRDHLACQRSTDHTNGPTVFTEWDSRAQLQRSIEEVPQGLLRAHHTPTDIAADDLAGALPALDVLRSEAAWRISPMTASSFEGLWQVAVTGRTPPSAGRHP